MEKEMNVVKVVLKSGKEVLFREMTLKIQNSALQLIGNKAKDNQLYAGALMMQELVKLLIVQIDGKKPAAKDLEQLDSLFTFSEIQQLQQVVGKLMGGDEPAGELETEHVTIGAQ